MVNDKITFGILVDWPDHRSMYQRSLIKGIQSYTVEHDINLLTLVVGRLGSTISREKPRELLYDFMDNDKLFSGFILLSSSLTSISGTKKFAEKVGLSTKLPAVSIAIDIPEIPSVTINNKPGFQELIKHMILHHGFADIAYISGPEEHEEAIERLQVFRNTLLEHNLDFPDSHLYFGSFDVSSGAVAIKCFFDDRGITPKAVICANDNMAIGAWEELTRRGLSIPKDIALTGFDDLQVSEMFDLPFTTVKQPLYLQGYQAAEKLHRAVQKLNVSRVTSLPSVVLYRQSCGCDANAVNMLSETDFDVDKSFDNLIQEYKKQFNDAVLLSITTHVNEPIMQCWNNIIHSALDNHIRQSTLISFLNTILDEYRTMNYPLEYKQLIETDIEKLRRFTIESYVRSDTLKKVMNDSTTEITIGNIENLGSGIADSQGLEERLHSTNWFFHETGINNCQICLFNNLDYEKSGESKIVFCRKDGEMMQIQEQDTYFKTKKLLHLDYLPGKRFELITELLFDQKNIFGMLILDMKKVGFNFYEMLRTRISTIIRDSINRKLLQETMQNLQDLSLTDELTGLFNRRGFFTMSEQQLRYCIREEEPYALYYIDLDGLKKINDTLGHEKGDCAITMAAKIIQDSFRETDIIARLGGDEFTVFASNTDQKNEKIIKTRLQKNIAERNQVQELSFIISMSIGTCYSSEINADDPSTLLEKMLKTADNKMYETKSRKKKYSR
ncbi:MAG: GGDEF domain-containing protein [Spirochaetales bacterium]|nr:GGDEF domain-containing protein [Spirochaetales bacterium]